VRSRILDSRQPLERQRDALGVLLRRSARWKIDEEDGRQAAAGMRRVYAHGRHSWQAAARQGSSEDFHEWRKQAQYLWYQMQILEPAKPKPIGKRADQLHKLTDCLGDDHDLYVLRGKAAVRRGSLGSKARQDALLVLIDRRRAGLQERALVLGRRLYKEEPVAFEARVQRYWQAWTQRARRMRPASGK
jgi:CHAD domain-containing protein